MQSSPKRVKTSESPNVQSPPGCGVSHSIGGGGGGGTTPTSPAKPSDLITSSPQAHRSKVAQMTATKGTQPLPCNLRIKPASNPVPQPAETCR